MDFLKRNWFWLLSGGFLLAFGAFFVLQVWSERGENAELQEAIEGQKGTLQGWVGAPKSVPPAGQAEAYALYAATLVSELDQSQALLKAGNRWKAAWPGPDSPIEMFSPSDFKGAYRDKIDLWLLAEDPSDPARKAHLRFLASRTSFDLADYKSLTSREAILPAAKRLMIQLDLVDILNGSGVLRLVDGGIRFEGGTDASAPSLRAPLKGDPRRATHPFCLKVELKFQDLPVLMGNLIASSFNYAVTGLAVERLKGKDDREDLILQGLLHEDQRNEVVLATLCCEASEYLFGEKTTEKKP